MRVKLDCEAKYVAEKDPWGIGEADSPRYDLYLEWISARARTRGSILDVGCGFGAMLARLHSDFERLHGIELSADAIAKGSERYPFIDFEQGSIEALAATEADRERFDAIIFSDVLYYVEEAARRASLRWIAEHLRRDGFAFIAAYSPGGREYPTPAEVRTLVQREFVIERDQVLDSEHLMLLVRPRRRFAALTLDYETWQPVPAGRQIDWDRDVFEPTDALLDACDAERARLTIFAELGEHAFLREHQPEIAARMEAQWRDAIRRGHDVQLHLHPNWLPELGARLEDGRYVWNERLTRAEEHPDLVGLLGRLKETLEQVITPVEPSYATVAFRAGGYEAQPFRRLAEALCANELWCDSSVYHGGRQPGVYHDYSHPCDSHQPWFASHSDPQLQAPPAERGIVELPVATFARNDRWTFDMQEGARFGERLIATIEAERTVGPGTELARKLDNVRALGASVYARARVDGLPVDRLLPRRGARSLFEQPPVRAFDDDFYVAVGHSKADLDIPAIRRQLRALREAGVEVLTLTEMALHAREQLDACEQRDAVGDAHDDEGPAYGPRRVERSDAPARTRGATRPSRLPAMAPFDRTQVLELGKMGFAAADLPALPFAEATFDCVCAENALEHVRDVDAALAEVRRVLVDGGMLLAAIPCDADRRPQLDDKPTWRISPADARERLRHAGFRDVDVEQDERSALGSTLGAAPQPPAGERMLYVRAWRRTAPLAPLERVDELRRWTHARLAPGDGPDSHDPVAVLRSGHASAAGMTLVLGEALAREGFEPRWVTMLAHEHPHGRGPRLCLRHEVLELTLADHSVHVLDPMADVRFPYALAQLLDDATLADDVERESDATNTARRHDLYASSFWYRRVVAVAVRRRPRDRRRFVPARWADRAPDSQYEALAFVRLRAWRAMRRLSDRGAAPRGLPPS
jgi:SAM-dependent methyltransferase